VIIASRNTATISRFSVLPRARAQGEAFGLGQRFKVGLDPGQGRALYQRADLGDAELRVPRLHIHVLRPQQ
jgi:hypothetical protein